jgi:hypothetical protein
LTDNAGDNKSCGNFVGKFDDFAEIANSFYEINGSNLALTAGNKAALNGAIGKSESVLKSGVPLDGFGSIWLFEAGNYPQIN